MSRLIFPTFEEIDKGYCTYEKAGRFRGVDDDGNPLYAKSRYMEVVVAHNEYKNYIAIDIVLDHKYRRDGFRFGRLGKWRPYIFEYSKDGYEKMLKFIHDDLSFDKNEIQKLIEDLENLKGGEGE